MIVSRNWLQTYFKKEIPDANKLADLFTFHACEVESVEAVPENGELKSDVILDLKVLPDRAHYALCHKGIAQEIAVITKLPIKERYVPEIKSSIEEKIKVTVEDSNFCKRYIARTIELDNVPKESPIWLKNALHSIGQRSINPIVDITNYVMYDIGQPLHAFDADKVVGELIIRSAKQGEKITLLDDREIILTTEDSVIADEQGALVIAGAKGGKRAEIDNNTKKIIIESANFHPTKVRRTSTKYDIRSDSSKRFENEITPELAIHGMNNVCGLIQEMIPNAKFGPIIDIYPNPAKQTVIEFDFNYIKERLGIEIPENETKNILEGMGISIDRDQTSWSLTIPFERLDLNAPEDIVEEVGRIYGYDKVNGILPTISTETKSTTKILPIFYVSELIKSFLIELGFSEVSLYSLVKQGFIETAKPLAHDKAFARSNLTDGMLDCVQRNILNADLLGLEAIKIFEIGHVFTEEAGERTHLAIGVSQIKKVKGFKSQDLQDDVLKKLCEKLNIEIKGKTSKNKAGNIDVIEFDLNEIVEKYKTNFDINNLNLKPASNNHYAKFSLYPFIVRDIAVFVPELITNEKVWEVIIQSISNSKAKELLVRHSLFDTFKKEGKVSYAFRMIFQSMDRTLTDDEINQVMENINGKIKENGWEVR